MTRLRFFLRCLTCWVADDPDPQPSQLDLWDSLSRSAS